VTVKMNEVQIFRPNQTHTDVLQIGYVQLAQYVGLEHSMSEPDILPMSEGAERLGLPFYTETYLFRVSVKEQIHNNIPLAIPRNGATETQNFPCQQPPHQANRMCRLKLNI
jgi:hypothetical protein